MGAADALRLVAKRRHGWELCICDGRLRFGDERSKVRMNDRYNSALITVLTAKQQRFAIKMSSLPSPVLARGRLLR